MQVTIFLAVISHQGPMTAERLIEFSMLLGYLGVLLWIGIRAARRVRTSTDYTLAGRDVPWIVVLATTAATMIGGGASVGMVSRVYEVGVAAALVTCAWHLQLIFTGLFAAPKLRGLNLITVGDYFGVKFGPLARELAVANCIIFLVGAIAAQMAAIGTMANAILGIPYGTALLIGGAVTIFYSTVGGIRAVVSTDVVQFVILVIGIGTASTILLNHHDGFASLSQSAPNYQFHVTGSWSTMRVISLFFAFLLGETFVPPYTVRCFIARDSRQARLGVAGAGIFLLLFLPIATFTLGTSARTNPEVGQALQARQQEIISAAADQGRLVREEQALEQAQQIAFPALVRTTFPPLIAGVVIAAIIAAVMSSADSCLSCLATVFMEDIYRQHWKSAATDGQLLRVAQATTLFAGIAATVCAWIYQDIAGILEFVYDFWAPTMVLPFLVAIFWYREQRVYAVVASMIAGSVATMVWRFVFDSPYDLGPALVGFLVAMMAFFLAIPLTSQIRQTRLFQPDKESRFEFDAGVKR